MLVLSRVALRDPQGVRQRSAGADAARERLVNREARLPFQLREPGHRECRENAEDRDYDHEILISVKPPCSILLFTAALLRKRGACVASIVQVQNRKQRRASLL